MENLVYLLFDEPDLSERFSSLILRSILGIADLLDGEAGLTPETRERGSYWCDDNCCNLTAEIHGQLAPFTFSRNEEVNIVAECLRDFEMSREHKGLIFTTAGSINYGSRLSGLRLIMSTIQNHCRY